MKSKLQRNCLILSAVSYAIVIYGLCVLCSCAGWKPNHWTKADTAREAAFLTVLAVDYGQTADIVDSPEYYELNPILGRDPSIQQVRWYFAGCAIGHYCVARIAPTDFHGLNLRKWWQHIWIVIEGGQVWKNASIGIGWRF